MENENGANTLENVEDIVALKERLAKAEAKIVELKKSKKAEVNTNQLEENATTTGEKREEEVTVAKEDKEAIDIEAKIAEAVKQALQEKEFEQREAQTNKMGLVGEENTSGGFKVLTPSEYDSLSISEQKEYMNKSIEKFGELELTFES